MKRYILAIAAALLLAGCAPMTPADTAPETEPTLPPVGWHAENGKQYYYADGVKLTGWLITQEQKFYLDAEGAMVTGWLEVDGHWYYFGADGIMATGWQEIGGERYFLGTDGIRHTGWLEQGSELYYFRADGTMAKGKQLIEGQYWYFTAAGVQMWMPNPWNYIPREYTTELTPLEGYYKIASVCYEDFQEMMEACRKAGFDPQVASSFRTWGDQEWLFDRKVRYYQDLGYDLESAKKSAGTVVAVPGTSEHQLGLALDLVDGSYRVLDEAQENTPTQKWLMENSWRYGFILRYPNGKNEVTGIIYEPWHYRYVGKEMAMLVYESGLCLEEYMDSITN